MDRNLSRNTTNVRAEIRRNGSVRQISGVTLQEDVLIKTISLRAKAHNANLRLGLVDRNLARDVMNVRAEPRKNRLVFQRPGVAVQEDVLVKTIGLRAQTHSDKRALCQQFVDPGSVLNDSIGLRDGEERSDFHSVADQMIHFRNLVVNGWKRFLIQTLQRVAN